MAEEKLSDFQRKKIRRVFRILYDLPTDGTTTAKSLTQTVHPLDKLLQNYSLKRQTEDMRVMKRNVQKSFLYNNKDGVLGLEDFELATEKICEKLKWTKEDDHYKKARETLLMIWDGLKLYADENKDGKVSEDEWLRMWEDCISEHGFPEWQQRFLVFMFDVNDTSGDGMIDEGEYTAVWNELYGIKKNDCEIAFQRISQGKNISLDEYKKLWMEYFLSNDRTAKGNYLFGVPDEL